MLRELIVGLGFVAKTLCECYYFRRGTMDQGTTRILGIHIAALLPPTSTELDVAHNVQVSAILSIGLVYQGTAHRHFAEVLLAEIGSLMPDIFYVS